MTDRMTLKRFLQFKQDILRWEGSCLMWEEIKKNHPENSSEYIEGQLDYLEQEDKWVKAVNDFKGAE